MSGAFGLVILGAQRTGVVNALAEAHGVSHKCLVPICGRPLLAHVLDVAAAMPDVAAIRVSIEAEAHDAIAPLIAPFVAGGATITLVPSSPGIADSALDAMQGLPAPWIITTADNVLITATALRQVRAMLDEADVVIGLSTETAIKAAHPEAQRNFYRFKDGGHSNCNLYAIRDAGALGAVETFREGGQFQKNPRRLIAAFGLINILMFRQGWLTVAGAMRRVGRRFGLDIRALVFADGKLAIDVDNERTYAIAEGFLPQRIAERG